MRRHAALLTCLSIALCACALPSTGTEETAAVIEAPSEATHTELQQAVNALLGKSVMLASDALTQSNVLVIDRTPARDSTGRRIEARSTELADRLRLVKRGDDCVLIDERTQQERVLSKIRCKAATIDR